MICLSNRIKVISVNKALHKKCLFNNLKCLDKDFIQNHSRAIEYIADWLSDNWQLADSGIWENEVLIKVNACGVCRTDLHVVEGELGEIKNIVPGEEFVSLNER